MKGVLLIVGLIIIVGGIWFLQQSEPLDPGDSVQETGMNEDTTSISDTTDGGSETTPETEAETTEAGEEPASEVDSETSDRTSDTGDNVGTSKEFTVDSFNFGYSMDEIRVNEGDTVTITLTNSDGFHDWVVDEFDAATETINEGETTTVTFVADTAGTYEYYCSVGNHRAQGMVGTLVVE